MATCNLSVRISLRWWLKPYLFALMVIACISGRAYQVSDATLQRGIKTELANN